MTILYLGGPMTGIAEHNFPAFEQAAKELREVGYRVVSPAEMEPEKEYTETWEYFMKRDLKALLDCDGIAFLPDWEDSGGAQLEFQVATALKIKVRTIAWWLEQVKGETNVHSRAV